jgi:GT2 family glycosyltransferase
MISIVLATTGRPQMAEQSVLSLLDSTDHELDLVVAVDNDEETTDRLVDIDYPRLTIDYSETYRGPSKAWNDALRLSTGDPVVLAADDLVWHPGWADHALRTLSTLPDGWGLVGFNDGHWDGDNDFATHYMVSRRFIVEELGGVIAWEHYRHSFNDREINERAKRAGRFAWCKDAYVYHAHWLFGDRPQDGTDSRALQGHAESQNIFMERLAAGFPCNYEPAIRS